MQPAPKYEYVILEGDTFFALLEEALTRISRHIPTQEQRWVTAQRAMELLGIKSRTTLQRLRDEGKIRYSRPERKHIMYDRLSIEEHLEAHAIEPFAATKVYE